MYNLIINEDINANDLRRITVGGIGGVGHVGGVGAGHVAPVVPFGGVSVGGPVGAYGYPFVGGFAAEELLVGPPYPYPNPYSYPYYPY
ncbi:spore coat protein [Peribacillus butanolivorans]|uniref:spore coat protein n=1 Tax=Peribacillus butanolivorans TaxID=421767 RepID=UPI0037CB485B